MKIRIFDSAKLDLADGYFFYEEQESGIGQYFLDSLYSDIDSLALYAGIHPKRNRAAERFDCHLLGQTLDGYIYLSRKEN